MAGKIGIRGHRGARADGRAALAEIHDLSLGDLLEGIVLHAFEGKAPFSPETLGKIADLKRIYELDLDASHAHRLTEQP